MNDAQEKEELSEDLALAQSDKESEIEEDQGLHSNCDEL